MLIIRVRKLRICLLQLSAEGFNIKPLNLNIMKKLLVIVLFIFSSCTKYVVEGAGPGGCGAWHPKKFKGNKPPRQRIKMSVINY